MKDFMKELKNMNLMKHGPDINGYIIGMLVWLNLGILFGCYKIYNSSLNNSKYFIILILMAIVMSIIYKIGKHMKEILSITKDQCPLYQCLSRGYHSHDYLSGVSMPIILDYINYSIKKQSLKIVSVKSNDIKKTYCFIYERGTSGFKSHHEVNIDYKRLGLDQYNQMNYKELKRIPELLSFVLNPASTILKELNETK